MVYDPVSYCCCTLSYFIPYRYESTYYLVLFSMYVLVIPFSFQRAILTRRIFWRLDMILPYGTHCNTFFKFFHKRPSDGVPVRPSSLRRKKTATKKAAAAIFPARVFSPPGRLTSEFGMGSGVSAWPSQPPQCLLIPRKPNAIVRVDSNQAETETAQTFHVPRKGTESSGYWCVLALQIALPAPDVHRTTRLVVPLLHIGWEA